MKAAWYEKNGSASEVLRIGDIDIPEPGVGEVLVRVHVSSVNPSDVKARAGVRGGNSRMPFPRIIPHSDGAGVVEKVGPNVQSTRIGERVWLWNGQWQRPFGTAAEYICVPSRQAVPIPDGIDFTTAASFGIPGLTAAHCVMGDGSIAGQSILINGGAGTVGYLMLQLAFLNGANVITTVGSDKDFELAYATGAKKVIRYDDPDLQKQILDANSGNPIERVIDVEFGCNIENNVEVIKPRGKIVTYGSAKALKPELPFYPLLFKGVSMEFVLVYLLSSAERSKAISCLYDAADRDGLIIRNHSHFTLDQIAEAHQLVEAGGRSGSVIIDVL